MDHEGQNVSHYDNNCPRCKKGNLKHRTGKYGSFLGCSTWPRCTYTKNVVDLPLRMISIAATFARKGKRPG